MRLSNHYKEMNTTFATDVGILLFRSNILLISLFISHLFLFWNNLFSWWKKCYLLTFKAVTASVEQHEITLSSRLFSEKCKNSPPAFSALSDRRLSVPLYRTGLDRMTQHFDRTKYKAALYSVDNSPDAGMGTALINRKCGCTVWFIPDLALYTKKPRLLPQERVVTRPTQFSLKASVATVVAVECLQVLSDQPHRLANETDD